MPNSAKLADFFQGHFIRFWNRGQAGNGVCERFGAPELVRWGDGLGFAPGYDL